MLIIDNVLVSEEIITEYFCCNLEKCQGMCCVEGDMGAPIAPEEIGDMEDYYPIYKQYMTAEGINKVDEEGTFDYDMEGEFVTPLLEDEACAFVYYEESVAKCAIEKAFLNGEIPFQKPISCHLYPIRIKILPDYEALNLHHWGVCEDACIEGKKSQTPVYQFLKGALTRKYGEMWYEKLDKREGN
ncbi:MAG: DUF3109 family protein [Bacteroidales bacterium]|jgi:hypothetical protein|nr:DUF3109 family protein [Bacteroidales bacterium]